MQPLMLFPFVFNGWILMQCINLQFHQPTTFLIRVRARSRPLAKLSHLWRRDCRRELLVKSTGDAGELDESSRGDKTECKNAIQIASVDENSPTLRKRSRRAFIRHFSKLATREREREREREAISLHLLNAGRSESKKTRKISDLIIDQITPRRFIGPLHRKRALSGIRK